MSSAIAVLESYESESILKLVGVAVQSNLDNLDAHLRAKEPTPSTLASDAQRPPYAADRRSFRSS